MPPDGEAGEAEYTLHYPVAKYQIGASRVKISLAQEMEHVVAVWWLCFAKAKLYHHCSVAAVIQYHSTPFLTWTSLRLCSFFHCRKSTFLSSFRSWYLSCLICATVLQPGLF